MLSEGEGRVQMSGLSGDLANAFFKSIFITSEGVTMAEEEVNIIRIHDTDIDGSQHVVAGLQTVKGIGVVFANGIISALGIDTFKLIEELSENEIEQIEGAINEPDAYSIPDWLVNRRKDSKSGKNTHIVGPQLDITHEFDVRRLQKMKAYRGVRHALDLPVRGQKTKSSFRGDYSIGVSRKKQ